jgi:hypothetical protein
MDDKSAKKWNQRELKRVEQLPKFIVFYFALTFVIVGSLKLRSNIKQQPKNRLRTFKKKCETTEIKEIHVTKKKRRIPVMLKDYDAEVATTLWAILLSILISLFALESEKGRRQQHTCVSKITRKNDILNK